MRPDPDSDQAGAESEYGDDTGFAAEATRTSDPDSQPVESNAPDVSTADTAAPETAGDDTAGLTAEDDEQDPGAGAD
ncbi:MAG TPA: hypothetical protein VLM05_09215 [Mycobacteriales bacterium]|nr:hypothetical protein [Mycobacteriales bacterium]